MKQSSRFEVAKRHSQKAHGQTQRPQQQVTVSRSVASRSVVSCSVASRSAVSCSALHPLTSCCLATGQRHGEPSATHREKGAAGAYSGANWDIADARTPIWASRECWE